jgi:hypothetical protein
VIRPDIRSTRAGLPLEPCCVAAMYSEWDRVLHPRNDVQLLPHWASAYRARQRCLCARLKCRYLLVGHFKAEIAHIEATIRGQSAQRLHIMNRIDAGILNRKLLCEWAGGIS